MGLFDFNKSEEKAVRKAPARSGAGAMQTKLDKLQAGHDQLTHHIEQRKQNSRKRARRNLESVATAWLNASVSKSGGLDCGRTERWRRHWVPCGDVLGVYFSRTLPRGLEVGRELLERTERKCGALRARDWRMKGRHGGSVACMS